MRLLDALSALRAMNAPVFETRDAGALPHAHGARDRQADPVRAAPRPRVSRAGTGAARGKRLPEWKTTPGVTRGAGVRKRTLPIRSVEAFEIHVRGIRARNCVASAGVIPAPRVLLEWLVASPAAPVASIAAIRALGREQLAEAFVQPNVGTPNARRIASRTVLGKRKTTPGVSRPQIAR